MYIHPRTDFLRQLIQRHEQIYQLVTEVVPNGSLKQYVHNTEVFDTLFSFIIAAENIE